MLLFNNNIEWEKTGTSLTRLWVSYNGQYICLPNKWCEFDSRYPLKTKYALIAQLVEQLFCNQQVGGSIPSGSLGVYCTDIIDWNGSLQFQRTIDTPLRLCGVMVSVPDCLSGGKGSIPFIVAYFENVV